MKKTYEEKVNIPIGYFDFNTYEIMDGDAVLDLALETLSINKDK